MKILLVVLSAFLGINCCAADVQKSYSGYKVHRLTLSSLKQLTLLRQLNDRLQKHQNSDEVEFWTDTTLLSQNVTQPVLVMVSPTQESDFLTIVEQEKIQHEVTVPDLAVVLEEESRLSAVDRRAIDNGGMTWTAYHRYATIEKFLENLAESYPDIVEKTTIGKSYEGRNLYLLKIGKARADGKTKPAIWMDSQIHAREWIASATLTYMVNKMVTEYGKNATATRMLNEIDWFVLPVVNVDGFEYTHTSVRLWRQTRRVNPFSVQIGADPNRNYDHFWMLDGADQTPGSEIYAGAYPFSEVENVFLTDAILERRKQIKSLMTFHSYAQMWLLPWGFNNSRPSDYEDMRQMGIAATNALKSRFGTVYTVGTSTSLLGAAAGATDDWGKAKGMIKYSFTVELRGPSSRGPGPSYGFILPPEQIIPCGQETFEAINVVAQRIFSEFGPTIA